MGQLAVSRMPESKDIDRHRDEHASAVDQALARRRIERLTCSNAELRATRSELQYDLTVSLEALAEERKQAAVAEARHRAEIAEEQHQGALVAARLRAVIAEEQHRASIAEEQHRASIAEEQHRASIAEEQHRASIAEEQHRASIAEEQHRASIAEEQHRASIAEEQHRASIAEEQHRASIAERDNQTAGRIAALTRQLADLRERLSLVVHDRKSLRRELQRRGRLLARARSELRAAQKSVAILQQNVRGLERANWMLEREAAGSKAWNKRLREQNAESARLIDQLADGFHAVRASRRWRLGSALLSVPRRLLFRPRASTTPDDMVGLVAEHRWRRTQRVPLQAMDEG